MTTQELINSLRSLGFTYVSEYRTPSLISHNDILSGEIYYQKNIPCYVLAKDGKLYYYKYGEHVTTRITIPEIIDLIPKTHSI